MDVSRVSGKDTLYSALYAPELCQGCWGDPMVPQTTENEQLKRTFSQKLKATVFAEKR